MAAVRARRGYSGLQVALHWIIAALVIFQLLVHEGMEQAWRAWRRSQPPGDATSWAWLHVAVGVAILLLALVRLSVRNTRGVPPLHRDKPVILVWIAYAAHILLYAFIIAMPLTGALAWFGGVAVAGQVHSVARLVLIPLIILHAVGALAEHFYFKNNSLTRMLTREA